MLKKLINNFFRTLFQKSNPKQLALASSLGMIIGVTPFWWLSLLITVALALSFRLNFMALLVGAALTFAGYEVPYFILGIQPYLFNSFLISIAFAVIAFPFFKLFYRWGENEDLKYNWKKSIFYDHSGERWMSLTRFAFILLGVVFVVVSIFAVSLSTNPKIPRIGLHTISQFKNILPLS